MATNSPKTNHAAKTAEKAPLMPPDEKFWQRYSPRYEFPVSFGSSWVIHFLVAGFLILCAFKLITTDSAIEVDDLIVGGGGGNPNGEPGGTGRGAMKEAIDQSEDRLPMPGKAASAEKLRDVEKSKKPLVKVESSGRLIEDDLVLGKKLSSVGEVARKRMDAIQQAAADKGEGGTGKGGGKGKGTGTGEGDTFGPGKGKINKRVQRQLRWTLIFNIHDPEDYARQLRALGAILAIPGPNDTFLVIDDVLKRPVTPTPRDVKELNRMYWIDDRKDSIAPLARTLGLSETPPYFYAFFPPELEKELLKKELEYRRLPEDRIEETRFRVRRTATGRGYEPVVEDQETK